MDAADAAAGGGSRASVTGALELATLPTTTSIGSMTELDFQLDLQANRQHCRDLEVAQQRQDELEEEVRELQAEQQHRRDLEVAHQKQADLENK